MSPYRFFSIIEIGELHFLKSFSFRRKTSNSVYHRDGDQPAAFIYDNKAIYVQYMKNNMTHRDGGQKACGCYYCGGYFEYNDEVVF